MNEKLDKKSKIVALLFILLAIITSTVIIAINVLAN